MDRKFQARIDAFFAAFEEAVSDARCDILVALDNGDFDTAQKLAEMPISAWQPGGEMHGKTKWYA